MATDAARVAAGQSRGWLGRALAALPCLALLALSACAGSALPNYDLSAPAGSSPAATRAAARLHLRDPRVADNLDSDRVLVRTGSQGFAVLSGAKWKERLPELLRARLAAALSDSAGFAIVDDSAPADFNLEMQVDRFELDSEPRQAAIELSVKLVSSKSGHVAATRNFSAHEPLDSIAAPAVIAALDRAYAALLVEIVAFSASR